MLTVRPVVAQFFNILCDFATREQELLGSKFRSILLNLKAVHSGEAGGEQFVEAARQAKQCMAHIVNTACKVQDVMEELLRRSTAKEFVKGFFEEYVQGLFIADYSELRTRAECPPLLGRVRIPRYWKHVRLRSRSSTGAILTLAASE